MLKRIANLFRKPGLKIKSDAASNWPTSDDVPLHFPQRAYAASTSPDLDAFASDANENKQQAFNEYSLYDSYQVKIRQPIKPERPRVVHALANFMIGGSSQLVVDLVEGLGHLYDQSILTCRLPQRTAYSGVPVVAFRADDVTEQVRQHLIELKPDILHFHYWGLIDELWYQQVFKAVEAINCKVIENVNTPIAPYRHHRVNQYVCVSAYVKREFFTEADRVKMIYPGSNFELFPGSNAHQITDCIGMVYRLMTDKLNKEAIEVFIEVVRRRPQTKCLIVGGGPLLTVYRERVASAGLSDNFQFTGFVSYENLPEYYRRLSIFVAPVWKESFGQVAPIAMNMGIPVVGYDVGGLPEIVGDSSLLAKPGDHIDLADILITLLENPQSRAFIGRVQQERAQRLFSLAPMILNYQEIYEKMMQGSIAS